MKKTLTAILLTALTTMQTVAQTKEGNFSYYLPKTEVRVALLVEKTTFEPGQFANYGDLLIKKKCSDIASTTYRIVGVTITSSGVPDEEKRYDLIVDKKHSVFSIDCDRNGVLKAINTKGKDAEVVPSFVPAKKPLLLDPNDYLNQDILASGNEAKMARLVAQEIYDIRDSKNQLARGEAEFMPKDGEQLKIMLAQLDTQEKALLQMFEGTTSVDTTESYISFIPRKENNKKLIFRFSKYFGLTTVDDLSGDPYYAVITDNEIIADAPTVEAEAKKHKDDMQIGYNLPGKITIEISNGGSKAIAKADLYAAQFGRVDTLDGTLFGKKMTSRVVLDTTTGAVVSLSSEPLE